MREAQLRKTEQKRRNVSHRFGRNRAIAMSLLAVIQVGLVCYIVVVVSIAREWRIRNALERHESTARLCARLLDEQCENAIDVLHSISRQPAMVDTRSGGATEQLLRERHLREAVQLVPDLMATALYDDTGKMVARYPSDGHFPSSAHDQPWFHHLASSDKPYVGNVVHLNDDALTSVFTIALPVKSSRRTTSEGGPYLVAFYRIGNTSHWLREVRIRDGAVLVSDAQGRVIMPATLRKTAEGHPALVPSGNLADTTPISRAMAGQNGALTMPHPVGEGDAFVGYSLAVLPRLAVLVVQPVSSALAPTDFLLVRVLWITVPLLILTPLAAWNLMNLYHREQHLTQRLSDQNERLEHNARLKSEVLANVSHDLKTPIASMQLSLSGMLETEEAKTSNAVRNGLMLFDQELAQLSARVRNLLDMSRLEVDQVPHCRETCDLTDIVAGALERLRMQVRDRPVTADFPSEPLLVECDQSQMEIAILNLLENAAKYSPKGSPIRLEGAFAEQMVRFSLRDEGPGIPVEDRERVFRKFYRVGTEHAAGGTGLGLTICKAIVEAHGGTVSLGEEEGSDHHRGATFIILLPRAMETI